MTISILHRTLPLISRKRRAVVLCIIVALLGAARAVHWFLVLSVSLEQRIFGAIVAPFEMAFGLGAAFFFVWLIGRGRVSLFGWVFGSFLAVNALLYLAHPGTGTSLQSLATLGKYLWCSSFLAGVFLLFPLRTPSLFILLYGGRKFIPVASVGIALTVIPFGCFIAISEYGMIVENSAPFFPKNSFDSRQLIKIGERALFREDAGRTWEKKRDVNYPSLQYPFMVDSVWVESVSQEKFVIIQLQLLPVAYGFVVSLDSEVSLTRGDSVGRGVVLDRFDNGVWCWISDSLPGCPFLSVLGGSPKRE